MAVDVAAGGIGTVRTGASVKEFSALLLHFEANVVRFTRATLNDGGKRIRRRMIRERLSGVRHPRLLAPAGAPLSKRSGKLIRSIFYKPKDIGDVILLVVSIGGGKAYYAEQYEESGRLQFGRISEAEMKQTLEELQIGFELLARSPGQAGVLSSGSQEIVEETVSDLEASIRTAWFNRGDFDKKAKEQKEYSKRFRNLRLEEGRRDRASRSGARAFRSATAGFEAFGLMGSGQRIRAESTFGGREYIRASSGFGAFGI